MKKRKIFTARFVNAKITSTISISLVLVLLGLTILILFMGNGLSNFVKENMSFSVMLDNDITDAGIQRLRKSLDAQPFVKSSRFISKDEAKEQLIKDLGEDPEELLGYNPVQDAIEIYLHSEYANNDSIAVISRIIRQQNNVHDLLYQQEAIDLINDNLSKVTMILLILAAVLMFISFTLIRNTIRLSVYSRRFIINTMKLVGANGNFIRKPFIRNNILTGIVAGVLADGIIFLILAYFSKAYVELKPIISITDLLIIFSIVILLGIFISTVATYFAVNRYLKMKTENLYYV
ncbi:MAG: ABC transporter permease [Petrimonas sp.]|uniref:cell division protein FtsX n=1 Tax=Petrimonas sp. TaxID=2023866 RepID=UPI000AEB545F|nr:ABC transporter permease [Petrimonas sp.]MEA4948590.1 ABC transporter permease [Petrimonas sp.]MEA4980536.1 ABC transporter permease [Petrimonas sp.]MEA5046778.1 ABC transporter permease [Petrimonas sp.]MEA5063732.1 ABC transporter permease [Petrimonas sp.]